MCVRACVREKEGENSLVLSLLLGKFCFQIVIKAGLTFLKLVLSVVWFFEALCYLLSLNIVCGT